MRTCETCGAHMGAGCCRDNLEGECREGGGFEAWREKAEFSSVAEAAEYAEKTKPEGSQSLHIYKDVKTEMYRIRRE